MSIVCQLSLRHPHFFLFNLSLIADRAVHRTRGTEGFSHTWCILQGTAVSAHPLQYSIFQLMYACVCACVLYLQTFVSVRSTVLEKPGTDHTEVAALKKMAPRSLQGPQSQLVRLHCSSHTDDYPLGGHCASHLPPGPAVRHGRSWSLMGDSGLCSVDRHAAAVEVLTRWCFTLALNRK